NSDEREFVNHGKPSPSEVRCNQPGADGPVFIGPRDGAVAGESSLGDPRAGAGGGRRDGGRERPGRAERQSRAGFAGITPGSLLLPQSAGGYAAPVQSQRPAAGDAASPPPRDQPESVARG